MSATGVPKYAIVSDYKPGKRSVADYRWRMCLGRSFAHALPCYARTERFPRPFEVAMQINGSKRWISLPDDDIIFMEEVQTNHQKRKSEASLCIRGA